MSAMTPPQKHLEYERHQALCAVLESTWHENIPITNALGARIESFDGTRLLVAADFEANINLHGTAFAGSLYAMCALCGWSAVHLQLALAGVEGAIVLAEGKIRYAAPVRDAINVACDWREQTGAIESLRAGEKKAHISLTTQVLQNEEAAALFEGRYAVHV